MNPTRRELLALTALATALAAQDGVLHEPRDGAGRGVADGERLHDVVALEHRAHAGEELGGIDLRAVEVEHPLDKHGDGHCAQEQQQPHNRPARGE